MSFCDAFCVATITFLSLDCEWNRSPCVPQRIHSSVFARRCSAAPDSQMTRAKTTNQRSTRLSRLSRGCTDVKTILYPQHQKVGAAHVACLRFVRHDLDDTTSFLILKVLRFGKSPGRLPMELKHGEQFSLRTSFQALRAGGCAFVFLRRDLAAETSILIDTYCG